MEMHADEAITMHSYITQTFIYAIRAFRLTRAIARAHGNLYSAEKFLFHRIFSFQSFIYVYEHHFWIMRYMYMSIAWNRGRDRVILVLTSNVVNIFAILLNTSRLQHIDPAAHGGRMNDHRKPTVSKVWFSANIKYVAASSAFFSLAARLIFFELLSETVKK